MRAMHRKWSWLLLLPVFWAGFAAPSLGADYAMGWGPPIGAVVPVLEAVDQDGNLRDLSNLSGERGFLLFLNRSADW